MIANGMNIVNRIIMKNSCLMCIYAFGRTCKKKNEIISDNIYKGNEECDFFKSIAEEDIEYENDSCCNENMNYYKEK